MHHSIYRHNTFIISINKYEVGEGEHYQCQRESNDGNRHRRKMLVMHYSHVILVTEQSCIDGLLDAGVAVWIVTLPTHPGFLWTEWDQCPSG